MYSVKFNMISLKAMVAELNLDDVFEDILQHHWQESTVTATAEPDFLTQKFIDDYFPVIGNNETDVIERLQHTAKVVRNSAALTRLACHAHYLLCHTPENPEMKLWPELDEQLGDDCGLFYLLIALSLIPEIFKTYKKIGVPAKYAEECCKWIGGTIQIYRSSHNGNPGHSRNQTHWIKHYIAGNLFRIGRFEYMNQTFPDAFPIIVYKNRKNGAITVLAKDQLHFTDDGYIFSENEPNSEIAFTSCLNITDDYISGTPISPDGIALNKEVKLATEVWDQILGPDAFTPGIHIPGGGKMSPEACKTSFIEALEFYKKYFPEQQVDAFVCVSWIFWPEYEKAMPQSNLAKLMRELYLFPTHPSRGRDGLFFIFGRDDEDLTDYPHDNSVRRTMLDLYDKRQFLRSGGMFILPEHLGNYGNQYYRENYSDLNNSCLD
jgi:GNAT-like C-terminal domain